MSYGSGSERSHSGGGCGASRRRKRRRQRADDLLSQLGLGAGVFYWDGGDGMGDGTGEAGAERSKQARRIEELEKTVVTMGETITALADRVKVLERIVVDDEANISREIDKLKDDDA